MTDIIQSIQPYEQDNNEGFRIWTTDGEILVYINNQQDCCEDWGYFLSEDDTSKFIGAGVLGVEIVDVARNTRELPSYGLDDGEAMFVDIKTTQGTLQFVAYNSHNGYYGHSAAVVSRFLNHEVTL